jgi:hypothetical protein
MSKKSNDDHAGLLHCKDCASVRHGDELKPTRRASAHARCRPPATSIDERWCHQQVFTAIHDGDRHVQRPVTAVCNVVTLVPKEWNGLQRPMLCTRWPLLPAVLVLPSHSQWCGVATEALRHRNGMHSPQREIRRSNTHRFN